MPNHRYTPRRVPPSFLDRMFNHPFEIHLAILWFVAAVVMFATAFTDWKPSQSMETPSWIIAMIMGSFLAAGTGGVVHSLFFDSRNMANDWRRERVGLALGGLGLLGYAIAVLISYPQSLLSWFTPLCFAAPCAWRIVATFIEERDRRREVEEWKNGGSA